MKGKIFNQTSPAAQAESGTLTAVFTQTGMALSATLTISGSSTFNMMGLTGNGNLWLSGTANSDTLVLSAHLDKKGATFKGVGIIYNADGDQEITFSAKKQ